MPTPTDNTKQILVKPTSALPSKPQARLQKRNFDTLVEQKGYRVIHQKAIECPCTTVANQPLPDCRNCGGSGWAWINPTLTKAIVQSMNKSTKYKEWSTEILGTASITTFEEVSIGYMDKITVLDTEVSYTQIVKPQVYDDDGTARATLLYVPLSIEAIYLYVDSTTALRILNFPDDVVLIGNVLEFSSELSAIPNLTITVRYKHNQEYAILDIPRSVMSSESLHHDTKEKDHFKFPIHAIGRLFHYTVNETSIDGNYLFNNSFTPACAEYISLTLNGIHYIVTSYSQAQIDALNPQRGLIVLNTDTGKFQGWNGTEWLEFAQDHEWEVEEW